MIPLPIGHDKFIPISHHGSSTMLVDNSSFQLNDILCSLFIYHDLFYVHKLTGQTNFFIKFFPNYFLLKDIHMKKIPYKGQSDDGFYSMNLCHFVSSASSMLVLDMLMVLSFICVLSYNDLSFNKSKSSFLCDLAILARVINFFSLIFLPMQDNP